MLADYVTLGKAMSGCVHSWALNEASGTTAQDSVGGNNLTWGADVSGFLTTGPDGSSQVPVNNGSTNRIAIDATGFTPPTTWSLCWWQRQDLDETTDQMAWEFLNSPTNSRYMQLDYGYSGGGALAGKALLSVNYGAPGGAASRYFTKGSTGTWYFYCVTFNPTASFASDQIKIYRNGVEIGTDNSSVSQSGFPQTSMKFGIMGRNTSALPIKASACGFLMYNKVLSSAEMSQLYGTMTTSTGVVQIEDGKTSADGWNHNAFPGLEVAPDGNYCAIYHHADQHANTEGQVKVTRFSPSGAILGSTALTTVISSDPDTALADTSMWYSDTNELCCMWNTSNTPGVASLSTVVAHKIAFSTDSGQTWSTSDITSQLPFNSNSSGSAGGYGIAATKAIKVPAGTVLYNGSTVASDYFLMAIYGYDDKTQIQTSAAPGYVKVYKSTDKCRTWTSLSTSFPSTTTRDYDETALLLLGNGRILSLTRTFEYPSGRGSGTTYTYWGVYSDDGGSTWSTPTRALGTGTSGQIGYGGRPDLYQASSGVVFLRNRNMTSGGVSAYPAYRQSLDYGATWGSGKDPWDLADERFTSPPNGLNPRGLDVYSATVGYPGDPNRVAFIWCEEDTGGTFGAKRASLNFRVLQLTPPTTSSVARSFVVDGPSSAKRSNYIVSSIQRASRLPQVTLLSAPAEIAIGGAYLVTSNQPYPRPPVFALVKFQVQDGAAPATSATPVIQTDKTRRRPDPVKVAISFLPGTGMSGITPAPTVVSHRYRDNTIRRALTWIGDPSATPPPATAPELHDFCQVIIDGYAAAATTTDVVDIAAITVVVSQISPDITVQTVSVDPYTGVTTITLVVDEASIASYVGKAAPDDSAVTGVSIIP